ncbi:RELT-like protein 1 isoform X2 [Anabas testudineus]|uniref:RELT-like protein 1 isoform X2 n=1 Tax=Anabas testudineus TaxID=64144 RepID=UPI000E45F851|nr:RELT-like protein 1 isoform X2 [Anabas testudineus]
MTNSSAPDPPPIGTGDGGGATNPDYTVLAIVPVFLLLGLIGVVICHVLNKKGYRCTTEAQGSDEVFEEEKDPELGGELNDTFSDNNDTVGQIVHFIMNNEANSDALKAMINENSIDSEGPPLTPISPNTPSPPMTPISPGAPAGAAKHTCNHLHTIGGASGHKNICIRCNQKKWPLMRKPSARKAEHQRRAHHGEVTVLAVGRFRVTKCEKPARERRTLLITDFNKAGPTSPTEVEPKSRTTSESQQVQTDGLNKENR